MNGYDPRRHGDPLFFHMLDMLQSLPDPNASGIAANNLLSAVSAAGMPRPGIQDMQATIEASLRWAANASMMGAFSAGAEEGGIDWHEPNERRFYVLDKRSGAELAAAVDDLQHTDRYIRRGAQPPTRLLFIGPPGTGKTVGALWLGSQLGLPVALIRIDGVVAAKVGETASNLRRCFEEASSRQAVIVIDEFEAVSVSRSDSSPNVGQWNKETTSALLQLLDALPEEQIVIGATNVPEAIDGAVLRRLRDKIHFYPPDRDARAAMLGEWWRKAPHQSNAKKRLLDLTEGYSGDLLRTVADKANRTAARRGDNAPITVADVESAMAGALAKASGLTDIRPILVTEAPAPVQVSVQPPAPVQAPKPALPPAVTSETQSATAEPPVTEASGPGGDVT